MQRTTRLQVKSSAPHNELWLHGFQSYICQERMAFKITSMVNTIAMRGIHALTAKHAFSGDRHEIDI